MIKTFEGHKYDINAFTYIKEDKTLVGEANKLWSYGYPYFFPNGRRQFIVINPVTGQFRRFRLFTERNEEVVFPELGYTKTHKVLVFKSEDDIKCEVIMNEDDKGR